MKLYVLLNYLFLVFGTNDNEWWKKNSKIMNNVIEIESLSYKRINIRTYLSAHTLTDGKQSSSSSSNNNSSSKIKRKKQQINNKYEITFHTCNAIGIIENDSYLLSTNFLSILCGTSNHANFFLSKFAFLRTHLIVFFLFYF